MFCICNANEHEHCYTGKNKKRRINWTVVEMVGIVGGVTMRKASRARAWEKQIIDSNEKNPTTDNIGYVPMMNASKLANFIFDEYNLWNINGKLYDGNKQINRIKLTLPQIINLCLPAPSPGKNANFFRYNLAEREKKSVAKWCRIIAIIVFSPFLQQRLVDKTVQRRSLTSSSLLNAHAVCLKRKKYM